MQDPGAGLDRRRVHRVDVFPGVDGQRQVMEAGRVQLELLVLERLPQPERA